MSPPPWCRPLLIGLIFTFSAIMAPLCAGQGGQQGQGTTSLTILHFNDFHGRLARSDPDTLSFFGTLEEERQGAGEDNALVVATGDNIGASLFPSFIQSDVPTLEILHAMDLDAAAVGNHEFDRGFEDLVSRVIPRANFPYLGANVYRKGTTKPVLREFAIFQRAGVQVGVIGAITAEVPALVSPAGVAMLDFGDPVAAVNRVAAQLSDGRQDNGEADVLIAAYHQGASILGTLAEQQDASLPFRAMVEDTSPRVDVIFNGHTHLAYVHQAPYPSQAESAAWTVAETAIAAAGPAPSGPAGYPDRQSPARPGRPVLQLASYASRIGKVRLEIDPIQRRVLSATAENLQPRPAAGSNLPRVQKVSALLSRALAAASEIGEEVIGTTTAAISRAVDQDAQGHIIADDRALESPLTHLVANMYRDQLAAPSRGGVQIGVANPGGTRADLAADNLSFDAAAAVLPFANTLMTAHLRGSQFKTLLEQQWQPPGVVSRPYLQLGLSDNLTYCYDAGRPLGDRITSISLDGAPLDPDREYVVGSSAFLIGGGDNFSIMAEAREQRDAGLSDLEAWIEYLKAAAKVSPTFAKRGVQISPTPQVLQRATPELIQVSDLDYIKVLGAVPNTNLTATLDGIQVGAAPVTAGAAALTLTLPSTLGTGPATLVLSAHPSGTRVSIPVRVE